MAYDPLTTFTALQVLTSAIMNKVKDNFAALWPYSAAGDISYAASATTLTRLPKGTAYQALRMNSDASALEWGGVNPITGRQGGSATDWNTQGTTNYATTLPKIYVGTTRLTVTSGSTSAVAVTFPSAYTNKPIALATGMLIASGSTGGPISVHTQPSASGLSLYVTIVPGTPTFTVDVAWMAIGE